MPTKEAREIDKLVAPRKLRLRRQPDQKMTCCGILTMNYPGQTGPGTLTLSSRMPNPPRRLRPDDRYSSYAITVGCHGWPSARPETVTSRVARRGRPGLAAAPGIRVDDRCKGGSALCRAATPRANKNAAGEKTSNKYL